MSTGWDLLRQGRWERAREAFAADETPEAFEGLSWAAWWLDDADSVLRARAGVPALPDRGDAAAAARMAIWIGVDQNDFHGAAAVASGWFGARAAAARALPPGPDHGWLAFHEGYLAGGDGARELAVEAAEIGRRFGVPDLEMLGLALEGASLVADARVTRGCGGWTRPRRPRWRARRRSRSPAPGRAASSSPRAWPSTTSSGRSRGVTGSRSSPSATAVATCSPSAGPSTAPCTAGAATGARPKRCSRPRSRTSRARARPGRPARWRASPSCGAGRAGPPTRCACSSAPGPPAPRSCAAPGWRSTADTRRGGGTRGAPAAPQPPGAPPGPGARPGPPGPRPRRRGDIAAATAALAELREIDRLVGTVPLRAAADRAEGAVAAASGDHDAARARLEDAVDGFERPARRTRRRRRGWNSRPCSTHSGARTRPRASGGERSAMRALSGEACSVPLARADTPASARSWRCSRRG